MSTRTDKLNHNSTSDEYLDLVDLNDRVVGKALRSSIYANHSSNFRVVNAFVKNTKGQLWIPQRNKHKKIFPNALDFSMGGHVTSGETYDSAFQRETQEELHVDVLVTGYKMLGKLTPKQDNVAAFMQVYEIFLDKVPVYNKNDYISSRWLYPYELRTEIQKGIPAKSDLIIVLNRFYPLLNHIDQF